MYAVVETGGKQYRVQEGDVINVEKLNVEDGAKVVFDKVQGEERLQKEAGSQTALYFCQDRITQYLIDSDTMEF